MFFKTFLTIHIVICCSTLLRYFTPHFMNWSHARNPASPHSVMHHQLCSFSIDNWLFTAFQMQCGQHPMHYIHHYTYKQHYTLTHSQYCVGHYSTGERHWSQCPNWWRVFVVVKFAGQVKISRSGHFSSSLVLFSGGAGVLQPGAVRGKRRRRQCFQRLSYVRDKDVSMFECFIFQSLPVTNLCVSLQPAEQLLFLRLTPLLSNPSRLLLLQLLRGHI